MLVQFLDIAIGGLLTGGIYALIAVGFGLQYGVARVLNIAHGEFIMLGAFCTWTLFTSAGVTPLVSMLICAPFFFAIGFVIYRIFYTPLRTSSESPAAFEGNSMLASFGLLFVIQNLALLIWGSPGQGLFVPGISHQVVRGGLLGEPYRYPDCLRHPGFCFLCFPGKHAHREGDPGGCSRPGCSRTHGGAH